MTRNLLSLRNSFFFSMILLAIPLNTFSASLEADYIQQGTANLKEENYEEAVDDLKKARDLHPDSSMAAYLLGVAYKKTQNYNQAWVHLKDAVTLQPHVKEAAIELADVHYQLDDTKGALRVLDTAQNEGAQSARAFFLKGLVLLKSGRNMEAVDSFNKAKSLDAKLATSADFQIGVATLQDGRLSEAREIFREIVIRDPNSDIAQFANQYIETIKRRIKEERPFKFSLGLQYQYDDNVMLKPGDSEAAAGITNESDKAGVLSLRAEYDPRLKGPYGIKAQYSLYLNQHERLHDFDVQSHTVSLVPSYNFKGGSVNLLAGYNYTLVHDLKYLQSFTASPTLTFTLDGSQFAQTFARYTKKEYLQLPSTSDEDRNGNEYGVGAAWFYMFKENRGLINIKYEFNSENTEGKNWSYIGNKVDISLLYPLAERVNLNLAGEAYIQRYGEEHTMFGMKRADETYMGSAMLSYNLLDDMDIQAQYMYLRGRSNIAVFDYTKNVVSVGMEVRF